jgi:hypothetical protein
MEAVGAAATIVQLISFTGEVLVAGYSFIAKVKRAPKEIRELMRETAGLNALLEELRSLVEDGGEGTDSQDFVREAEVGRVPAYTRNALASLDKLGVFKDCEKMMGVVKKIIGGCERVEGEQVCVSLTWTGVAQ